MDSYLNSPNLFLERMDDFELDRIPEDTPCTD